MARASVILLVCLMAASGLASRDARGPNGISTMLLGMGISSPVGANDHGQIPSDFAYGVKPLGKEALGAPYVNNQFAPSASVLASSAPVLNAVGGLPIPGTGVIPGTVAGTVAGSPIFSAQLGYPFAASHKRFEDIPTEVAAGGALRIDPHTGWAVNPVTGLPVDPETGLPVNPATGRPVDVRPHAPDVLLLARRPPVGTTMPLSMYYKKPYTAEEKLEMRKQSKQFFKNAEKFAKKQREKAKVLKKKAKVLKVKQKKKMQVKKAKQKAKIKIQKAKRKAKAKQQKAKSRLRKVAMKVKAAKAVAKSKLKGVREKLKAKAKGAFKKVIQKVKNKKDKIKGKIKKVSKKLANAAKKAVRKAKSKKEDAIKSSKHQIYKYQLSGDAHGGMMKIVPVKVTERTRKPRNIPGVVAVEEHPTLVIGA